MIERRVKEPLRERTGEPLLGPGQFWTRWRSRNGRRDTRINSHWAARGEDVPWPGSPSYISNKTAKTPATIQTGVALLEEQAPAAASCEAADRDDLKKAA